MRTAVFAVSGSDRAFSHSVVHTMHPAEIIICPGYSRTQASFFMPLLCVSVSKSDFLHAAYIAASTSLSHSSGLPSVMTGSLNGMVSPSGECMAVDAKVFLPSVPGLVISSFLMPSNIPLKCG